MSQDAIHTTPTSLASASLIEHSTVFQKLYHSSQTLYRTSGTSGKMYCSTFFALLVAVLVQVTTVCGHMHLYYPPTFNASNNPHRTTEPDPYLDYPYNCCGRKDPFPCKGYLSLLGTPD